MVTRSVLEHAGERLTQTAPILLRLATRHGQFGGNDSKEQFEIMRWLFWDNHKLTSYLATYRYQRAFTPSPDPHVLTYFRKRIDDFLEILELHLQNRSFVVADRATVADISMVGYLSYPKEEAGYDLATSHPAINAWLGRVAKLPGWRLPYDLLPGKRLKLHV
jgi:glutathione S-transferase